ncbi:hypothetical protein BaRGS_00000694, partial [Batillaria attramentaria]
MKAFSFLLFAVIVEIVTPQTASPFPQKCCISRKFTATLTETGSINSDSISVMRTSIDYDRRLQAVRVIAFDPKTHQSNETARVVMDNTQ